MSNTVYYQVDGRAVTDVEAISAINCQDRHDIIVGYGNAGEIFTATVTQRFKADSSHAPVASIDQPMDNLIATQLTAVANFTMILSLLIQRADKNAGVPA